MKEYINVSAARSSRALTLAHHHLIFEGLKLSEPAETKCLSIRLSHLGAAAQRTREKHLSSSVLHLFSLRLSDAKRLAARLVW